MGLGLRAEITDSIGENTNKQDGLCQSVKSAIVDSYSKAMLGHLPVLPETDIELKNIAA